LKTGPNLSGLVPHLSVWDPERELEAGLRWLLRGFLHRLWSRLAQDVGVRTTLDLPLSPEPSPFLQPGTPAAGADLREGPSPPHPHGTPVS
jgi:hypothetical protein